MNKTKIFMGTAVLAIAAAFAAKASAKLSALTSVYYTTAGTGCKQYILNATQANFTTNGGAGVQATIKTVGGVRRSLWATSNCHTDNVPVHFNP